MSLEIFEYMKFRADVEKQPFDMPMSFFRKLLEEAGMRQFFGCTTDAEGNVLSDSVNPGALRKWRELAQDEVVFPGTPRPQPVSQEDNNDQGAVVFPRILPGGSRQRNDTRRMLSTCWTCGSRRHEKNADFKCCSRCFCACYCSEACQRADWEGGHRKVCKKLDRLNSLDKGAKIQLLSLQLSIKAIPEPEPKIHLIMYAVDEPRGRVRAHKNSVQAAFQFMCLSPPGYEECIRRDFPELPTGEPIFKFGGDMSGKYVFVTLSGKVIIYKQWKGRDE